MNDYERKLTPIKCNHITRDPHPQEMSYAGNNQILEVRIDFYFWNGSEWIEYGCGETAILNKVNSDNIQILKEKNEYHCWKWFSDMLQKGELEHDDKHNNKITSKVLAVARYPIYFEDVKEVSI